MDITLLPSHIPGVLNTRANLLSRDLHLQEPRKETTDTREKKWWIGLSRQETCWQLLMASISRPQTVLSQLILELLKVLQ